MSEKHSFCNDVYCGQKVAKSIFVYLSPRGRASSTFIITWRGTHYIYLDNQQHM